MDDGFTYIHDYFEHSKVEQLKINIYIKHLRVCIFDVFMINVAIRSLQIRKAQQFHIAQYKLLSCEFSVNKDYD